MIDNPQKEIQDALETLKLPTFVSKADIKKQYRFLAQKYHPDRGGDTTQMEQLNYAYAFLMEYIEQFRYSFDETEILKQFSWIGYANQFKP